MKKKLFILLAALIVVCAAGYVKHQNISKDMSSTIVVAEGAIQQFSDNPPPVF